MAIDVNALRTWLAAYGRAWEARDAAAAASLFAADARYFETPYAEPFVGAAGVREYWARVTADQRDVSFGYTIVGVAEDVGVARWNAKFTLASNGASVELDGVFLLTFDAERLCTELREWWHAR